MSVSLPEWSKGAQKIYKEESTETVLRFIALSYGPMQVCSGFFFLNYKIYSFFLIYTYYSFFCGLHKVKQLKALNKNKYLHM